MFGSFNSDAEFGRREPGMKMQSLLEQLERDGILPEEAFVELLSGRSKEDEAYAAKRAREIGDCIYGKQIYIRGLIEFTNYCKNNCYYCGIQRENSHVQRYRLGKEEILCCCEEGYKLGFRTFVLQGGEDPYYTDKKMIDIIKAIRNDFPDCAITLSIGEKSYDSYQRFYEAGADRYLLRHETADVAHYQKLHPKEMSLEHRMDCLKQLKEIGFQTGCGFMVGSPFQTNKELAKDLLFIHSLHPEMVGIGPFIPHKETRFAKEKQGTLEQTLFLLSLIRIMEKNVLLPATTALATIDPRGREKGILAGANVVMPNLSPKAVREKYALYDGKVCTGEEAAECRFCLENRVRSVGYEVVVDRGDYKG